VTDQLALFAVEPNGNGNGRKTKAEAGIRDGVPPGAERLLAKLVKNGLDEDDLVAAAALCLALENVVAGEGES
jgi:hypothetical protein